MSTDRNATLAVMAGPIIKVTTRTPPQGSPVLLVNGNGVYAVGYFTGAGWRIGADTYPLAAVKAFREIGTVKEV